MAGVCTLKHAHLGAVAFERQLLIFYTPTMYQLAYSHNTGFIKDCLIYTKTSWEDYKFGGKYIEIVN